MDSYVAANQEQSMLLSQYADMVIENERMETYFLSVRTLMDVDNLAITDENIEENIASIRHQHQVEVPQKIEELFDIVIEDDKTAKEAALMAGINIRTAQHHIKKYNDDEERRLTVSVRKIGIGRKARLTEGPSQFLIEYVDKYPAAILSDIRQNICEAFPGLSIPISVCIDIWSASRSRTQAAKGKIEEWEAVSDMDFTRNCVFVDEARFNLHTERNYDLSRKGTPSKSVVPKAKDITISIVGAILQAGVIDISSKKPHAVSTFKKRKVNDTTATVINSRVRTNTEHFLATASTDMGATAGSSKFSRSELDL